MLYLFSYIGQFTVYASGYNDKLGLLLRKVAQEMKVFDIAGDKKTFARIKESLQRRYRNFFMGMRNIRVFC